MKYNEFFWKHIDTLCSDTSLVHSFGEKVWNHKQQEIDELIKSIDWHIEDCDLRLTMNKNDYYQDGFKAALELVKKRLEGK